MLFSYDSDDPLDCGVSEIAGVTEIFIGRACWIQEVYGFANAKVKCVGIE